VQKGWEEGLKQLLFKLKHYQPRCAYLQKGKTVLSKFYQNDTTSHHIVLNYIYRKKTAMRMKRRTKMRVMLKTTLKMTKQTKRKEIRKTKTAKTKKKTELANPRLRKKKKNQAYVSFSKRKS